MAHAHLYNGPARLRRAVVLSVSKGFTLIELLVVTGIIVVISTIVLADNNRFGGVVQLENLAYDIALSVRQAQVYGISVQRFGTTFRAGYGVNLDTSTPSNQTVYEMFADISPATPDGMFQPNNGELVSLTNISNGYKISKLCAPAGTDSASCTAVNRIDIVFQRPEPDAWISAGGTACAYGAGTCLESTRIVLGSPRGDSMSIIVEVNGQISVQRR